MKPLIKSALLLFPGILALTPILWAQSDYGLRLQASSSDSQVLYTDVSETRNYSPGKLIDNYTPGSKYALWGNSKYLPDLRFPLNKGLEITVARDSTPPNDLPYELKRKGLFKSYKLHRGDTAFDIVKGFRFRYNSEFKKQFEPSPLAYKEMLKSQTYHYVGMGGQIALTFFTTMAFYNTLKCKKAIDEEKFCNPKPAHDVFNLVSAAAIWYYGSIRAHKHRKRAVELLNQQRQW